MKLTIKSICPECHGDAYLDHEKAGWSVTCPKCPHKVLGHVSPVTAMRAFRLIGVENAARGRASRAVLR